MDTLCFAPTSCRLEKMQLVQMIANFKLCMWTISSLILELMWTFYYSLSKWRSSWIVYGHIDLLKHILTHSPITCKHNFCWCSFWNPHPNHAPLKYNCLLLKNDLEIKTHLSYVALDSRHGFNCNPWTCSDLF